MKALGVQGVSGPSAPQRVSVPEGPLIFHTRGSMRWVWISQTCRNTIFLSLIAELAAESTWASRFWSSGRSDVLKQLSRHLFCAHPSWLLPVGLRLTWWAARLFCSPTEPAFPAFMTSHGQLQSAVQSLLPRRKTALPI